MQSTSINAPRSNYSFVRSQRRSIHKDLLHSFFFSSSRGRGAQITSSPIRSAKTHRSVSLLVPNAILKDHLRRFVPHEGDKCAASSIKRWQRTPFNHLRQEVPGSRGGAHVYITRQGARAVGRGQGRRAECRGREGQE